MCGICGIAGPIDKQAIEEMTRSLVHRGPDGDGVYRTDEIALGVRRLSIIDIDGGRQPISSEDGTVSVVFNGEIYNYREIRSRLETMGHRFRTVSDTEVLVHLYEEYGEDGVHLLRGMFACAIWDEPRRRLVLLRDRLGIKPLYYARVGAGLLFASEVKALLLHAGLTPQLDPEALDLYLTFQYVPGPRTLFKGVEKLQPGHALTFDGGRITLKRYWDVVFNDAERPVDLREAGEEFAALFDEAIKMHLVSDVPIGALLSGGIDSSAVVASMSRWSPEPVRTFTIGFDIPGMHNEFDEARAVARWFDTDHQEIVVTSQATSLLPKLLWHLDEPVADPAALPTFLLCQSARRSVPVVLLGEGGDELLSGYPRYAWFLIANRVQRLIPGPVRRAALLSANRLLPPASRYRKGLEDVLSDRDPVDRHLSWIGNFDAAAKARVFSPDLGFGSAASAAFVRSQVEPQLGGANGHAGDVLHRLIGVDVHTWLVDDVLTKVDKMSMAASVEARVPFLDHHLVEFVAALPTSIKLRMLGTKPLLREAMRGVLPQATLARRKHAFLVPVDQWLRGPLRDFLRDVLLSARARERGWCVPREVERLITAQAKGAVAGQPLWNLLCLELWAQAFLDGRAPA